ncbi:MAG: NUDIX hydrolase [Marinagarivorans sp.]|nr:NUDIX hydrolase [Marinagarivorans sp.]
MTWAPHVTVAAVIEHEGRYLVVKEIDQGITVFNQPAGHLEANETLTDAAIRETLEETGWIVKIDYLIGISRYIAPANQATYIRFTFAATAIELTANAVLDEGIIEAVWLTKDQLITSQALLRSPLVLNDIERFERGDKLPLSCLFDHPTQ